MPLYEFSCPDCGEFTLPRSVADRNAPAPCPDCGRAAQRQLAFPHLATMPGSLRRALDRDESSRHAPAVQQRHRCSSACGCGAPPRPPLNAVRPAAQPRYHRGRAGQRPWMLGH